jgi:Flp pilus assembly protein TadD
MTPPDGLRVRPGEAWYKRVVRPAFRVALAAVIGGLLLGCTSWRAARLYQSGTAALDSGRIELALAELEAASRLRPEASEIQNHLGLAHLAAGDRNAARRAFVRAVELDCDNVAAQRNLGEFGGEEP